MLRWWIRRRLDAEEKKLGASVDYLRHMVDHSLGGFLAFVKVMPLAKYRRKLPAGPYHVARIVAARHEDCGPCVQIEVNFARASRVAPALLATVLDGKPDDLPEELADASRFAEAVVTRSGDEGPIRERIRARYGEAGLVELALGIAACRVFPTTKRALGYSTSCSAVKVRI